jgi:hypothetical protein
VNGFQCQFFVVSTSLSCQQRPNMLEITVHKKVHFKANFNARRDFSKATENKIIKLLLLDARVDYIFRQISERTTSTCVSSFFYLPCLFFGFLFNAFWILFFRVLGLTKNILASNINKLTHKQKVYVF